MPAIPYIGRFQWASKTASQRLLSVVLGCSAAISIFVAADISSPHAYSPLTWTVVTGSILVFGSFIYWGPRLTRYLPMLPLNHFFYENSASVYTARGKRGHSPILTDRVRRIVGEEVSFEGERFRLYTVEFKDTIPGILKNYDKPKFGIPVSADLAPFSDWIKRNGLKIEQPTAAGITESTIRRSCASD